MDKDIFTLIKDSDEKLKLWQDLGDAKGTIICKGAEDALCNIRVDFFNSSTRCLEAHFENSNKMTAGEEYLGHFFLGGDKYYYQAKSPEEKHSLVLSLPIEIYKLQRRQNYRVHILESYPATYSISVVNSQPQKILGQLVDLSSQGCRTQINSKSPVLKVGDTVSGQLIINKRPPLDVQGVVRHMKMHVFGIEFTPLSPIIENKLFAITLELHKEFFKRT